MSFTQLGKNGVPGVAYDTNSPVTYQDGNRIRLNFDDHESRIALLEDVVIVEIPFTDTEMKAFPSGDVTLVSAQGANTVIQFLDAYFAFNLVAGYVVDTDAYIALRIGGQDVTDYIGNDSGVTPPYGLTTTLFSTGQHAARLQPLNRPVPELSDPALTPPVWGANGWWALADVHDYSARVNQALIMHVSNNGAGDFTGGNSGNAGLMNLRYRVITVP